MINKKMILAVLGGMMMTLNGISGELIKATPVFRKDGSINAGPKNILLKQAYGQFWMILNGNATVHCQQLFNFGEGPIGTVFFLDKTYKIIPERKEVVFTAKMRLMPLRFEKGISFGFSAAASDCSLEETSTKKRVVALPDLDWREPPKFLIATFVD